MAYDDGEGFAVHDITILFTDIAGSTALYDRFGDFNAFSMVQQHFSLLQALVVQHRGAVIKTIGDAIMAAFSRPADAIAAAAAMLHPTHRPGMHHGDAPLMLKIGVHRGTAIAVTLNERLDYFGQTVNAAARLQRIADPAEICISDAVARYPGVEPLLASFAIVRQQGHFRGMDRALTYLRLASRDV